ncbi:MAG: pentapeptide repeat-containing protein [Flexilinea sp.]
MKMLGKPKNSWGWIRIISCAILTGIILWIMLGTLLRNIRKISWIPWNNYQDFSLLEGFELATISLLTIIIAGCLEEQKIKMENERSNQRATEQAAIAQRHVILKQFNEAVQTIIATETPEYKSLRISERIQATLPELDGKSKGEMLHFLFEKGLLTGKESAIDLNGADFSGVDIDTSNFDGICLESADLTKGRMSGVSLIKSRLSDANLSRAIMRFSILREAVLRGSNLHGTMLEGADLEGVDLRGANLEDAFLLNANLKNCIYDNLFVMDSHSVKVDSGSIQGSFPVVLDQAILIDTIMPNGRKVTNDKGKEYLRKKEYLIVVDRL